MAAKIRKTALQTIQEAAGSGHIGGSFSIADILSVLYFEKMNVDPMRPDDPDRDRLVLSRGHCSPAMYATLALKGFFLRRIYLHSESWTVIFRVMWKSMYLV